MNRNRLSILVLLAAFVLAGVIVAYDGLYRRVVWQRHVAGLMSTDVNLQAVARPWEQTTVESALAAAEAELVTVEVLMSSHLEASELSRFNAAPADQAVELSSPIIEVLRAAFRVSRDSRGAFDVTVRPLLKVRKRASKARRLPTEQELRTALQLVGWEQVKLEGNTAWKTVDGVSIDLGGIAKGYGIDRAIEAIRATGCIGGLVDAGGDIRCFGPSKRRPTWNISVRDPFHPSAEKPLAVLAVRDAAVCTSGNYFRYSEIAGQRYSHIVDPRTGQSVETAASVTVVAPTALVADAWATALSVLGRAGLDDLPDNVQAMLVFGNATDVRIVTTEGFGELFLDVPPGLETPIKLPVSSATQEHK